MISIDDILISDDIVQEQFVCDLSKCKGGCCEDGDAGAPLEEKEMEILKEIFETVKPYLTQEGIAAIEKQGMYHYDETFGWVTTTVDGGLCAYGHRDKQGIIKCGIEEAYNDKKIDWKKPISCHLFPIRVNSGEKHEMLDYEPRESMCDPGCAFGKKLKVPVHHFLKEPIIRKYGEDFWNALDTIAQDYFAVKYPSEQK